MIAESDLVTPNEACELLRINPHQLRYLRRMGLIPYIRITPKTIRYSKKSLQTYLRKMEVRACPE
jgi:DNA-binding transcriptional MerR regulator